MSGSCGGRRPPNFRRNTGEFEIVSFESVIDGETHVALVCGDIGAG